MSLQGFPGPQGLVGLPGEKVRHFNVDFYLLRVKEVVFYWLIFVSQGPQGKKGMQGLPGNDGPSVSAVIDSMHSLVPNPHLNITTTCFTTDINMSSCRQGHPGREGSPGEKGLPVSFWIIQTKKVLICEL